MNDTFLLIDIINGTFELMLMHEYAMPIIQRF